MGSAASDITVSTLLNAKAKDLVFWIKQANTVAGHKVLTQKGTVAILRDKLAAHYGLDLTTSTKTELVIGLISMDMQLHREQWGWLRELGREWEAKAAKGEPFRLLSGGSHIVSPASRRSHSSHLNRWCRAIY
jgi:hypothetical protein